VTRYQWKSEYGWFLLFAACTVSFSLVQDVIRPQYTGENSTVIYFLGVLPNFYPAIGLPAFFMILLPYFASKKSGLAWLHGKKHITAMMISAGGLTAWELQQQFTPNGVFDWHDVLWTLICTGCFYLSYLSTCSNSENG